MNDLDPGIVAEVRAAYESEGRAYAAAVLGRHYPTLTESAARAVVERVLRLPDLPWDAANHHPWIIPPRPPGPPASPASRADRR